MNDAGEADRFIGLLMIARPGCLFLRTYSYQAGESSAIQTVQLIKSRFFAGLAFQSLEFSKPDRMRIDRFCPALLVWMDIIEILVITRKPWRYAAICEMSGISLYDLGKLVIIRRARLGDEHGEQRWSLHPLDVEVLDSGYQILHVETPSILIRKRPRLFFLLQCLDDLPGICLVVGIIIKIIDICLGPGLADEFIALLGEGLRAE